MARVDDTLAALGSTDSVPPLAAELDTAISTMGAVATRRPFRQWLLVAGASLAYAGALVWLWGVRRDIGGLPLAWVTLYGAAWVIGFAAFSYVALVPRAGDVMPRWRAAAIAAVIGAIAFPTGGLLLAMHVPGVSTMPDATVRDFLAYGQWCAEWGLITALVPVALASIALRGAVPVQSPWIGACLGAAGGSLGGAMLHFHCPIADNLHVGLVHGGVVVVGALLAALIVPRVAR